MSARTLGVGREHVNESAIAMRRASLLPYVVARAALYPALRSPITAAGSGDCLLENTRITVASEGWADQSGVH